MNSPYIPNYDFLELTSEKILLAAKVLLGQGGVDTVMESRKGWITAPKKSGRKLSEWSELVKSLLLQPTKTQYVIGMGGSALGAYALIKNPFIEHQVETIFLGSNHPGFIEQIEAKIDFPSSMFLICSKSGTTKETLSLFKYFFNRCIAQLGENEARRRFVSVTDPGSPLQTLSEDRKIFVVYSDANMGGRFSVLSSLSIIPALFSGGDLTGIIYGAEHAMDKCIAAHSYEEIPARVSFLLNCLKNGRDKVYIFVPPSLQPFGLWLVQLLAESLGKNGLGFIPVLRCLDSYKCVELYNDQCCLIIKHTAGDMQKDSGADKDSSKYNPNMMDIYIYDSNALGEEFYYWQYSVALIGLVMGVNPFDQPDVELSKKAFEKMALGKDLDIPIYEVPSKKVIKGIIEKVEFGKYVVILIYTNPSGKYKEVLESIRCKLESLCGVPVILDFGPGYLHSTGQLYKGGPRSGVFIQIVEEGYARKAIPTELAELNDEMVLQAESDYDELTSLGRFVHRMSVPFDRLEMVRNLVTEMD